MNSWTAEIHGVFEAIVGPDDRGDGQHFHLLGEVGDVYSSLSLSF